ncbi:MAG: hypothetical protein EBY81_04950, partial [Verrucomicrobia bacterium]|nr:hypothetical protein [Verrucomicrobiota bacterium]
PDHHRVGHEVVTNAVVIWSNNTNDYPVQAPQIGGTWVAQSLRLANPANPNTISWVAWTNTPAVGSTNSIRVEVTGSLLSFSSPATVKFVTNLPADSTSLEIPAGTLPTNQVYSAKVGFVTMTGGATRSTETQFRMVTGPMNPPAQPVLSGALIGNMNVTPGTDVVGTLAAFSDLDAGDTETLSLPTLTSPDANDNNLFVLDGRVIKLAGGTFDYATRPFYSILVRATDSYGLYSETAYTVSVQGTQSITFADLTKTYGDAPFDLTATAPGGAVTYTSSNTGVAEISGSTVTIKGAGVANITASQVGGGAYLAAIPVVKTLTVNQAASTISVTGGGTKFTYTGSGQGLDASTTTGSTGAVTYVYAGTGGTIYSLSPVKPTVVGNYTVTADLASSANYSGATSAPTAFAIIKATQAITGLASTGSKTYLDADYTLSVTQGASTSGLTYASSASGVATINSTTGLVSIKGAGTTTLTVNQAADANYNAATQVSQTLTVSPAGSTITVTGLTSFTYTGSAQGPATSTTTGSTGAVTYGYVGTGGTTYGPSPTKPTAAGSYTVTAGVASDANFSGATSSPATAFTIAPAASTISVTGVTSFTYDGNPQGPSTSTKT